MSQKTTVTVFNGVLRGRVLVVRAGRTGEQSGPRRGCPRRSWDRRPFFSGAALASRRARSHPCRLGARRATGHCVILGPQPRRVLRLLGSRVRHDRVVAWSVLAELPESDAQRVRERARRRTFARGEVVFHRGDPGDTLHLVSKGRFAVRITTPLGDTAVLAVLGPGQAFGELALLTGAEPRSATVAALEPAETRSLHRIDFEAMRARHPQTTELLVVALAEQVRRLSERLVEALYVPADRRILRRVHSW